MTDYEMSKVADVAASAWVAAAIAAASAAVEAERVAAIAVARRDDLARLWMIENYIAEGLSLVDAIDASAAWARARERERRQGQAKS